MAFQPFSVCMSVYKNDRPDWFYKAVKSIYEQSIPPNEIIIVVDGPIPQSLDDVLNQLKQEICDLRVIKLENNCGHAIARQTGLNAAKYNLVAVMDSDDVSLPDRFRLELNVFAEYPEVSVVGGLINEFVDDETVVVGSRIVPECDSEIKTYLKSRCPMNQMTVMFKKDDIESVGGYQDWYCNEDYFLWIRLALNGYKFYNLQQNLVNVRVGADMYRRRGGWLYFKGEARLQRFMFNHKIISCLRYLYNVLVRFVVQVAISNRLRGFLFQKLFRN